MAKKSMKDAAAAGTSVFDQIASGNVQNVNNVNNVNNVLYVKDVQNAKNAKGGRPAKYDGEMVRLNLKVPAYIKDYLMIAAAKASIEQRKQISLTEYLCELVTADREKNHYDE